MAQINLPPYCAQAWWNSSYLGTTCVKQEHPAWVAATCGSYVPSFKRGPVGDPGPSAVEIGVWIMGQFDIIYIPESFT